MVRPIHVLTVEDSEDDAQIVVDTLRADGFEPVSRRVDTAAAIREALSAKTWDVVLVDYSLPGLYGLSVLQAVQSAITDFALDIPVIVVSGSIQDEEAVAAMRAGAHDYLLKDNLTRLGSAVDRELTAAAERRGRRAEQEQLRYAALHDEATGLPNRFAMETRLREVVTQGPADGWLVLAFRLERLQQVRETFGEVYADLVVREITLRVQPLVRTDVYRVGDNRLAVLIAGDEAVGTATAEQVAHVCDDPILVRDRTVVIGGRVGIVRTQADDPADGATLIRRAELALDLARRTGSRSALHHSGLDDEGVAQLDLLGRLQGAITRQELSLVYQPKIALTSGALLGVEALMRWDDSEHGVVAPALFIPLAEQAGTISPLTQWVVTSALQQWSLWRRRGIHVPIAINLSALDLHESFVVFLRGALDDHNAPPSALIFEVTETAVMANWSAALHCLTTLATMGATVALDDFGTGYSSFEHLSQLPVHELKIDQSFVRAGIRGGRDRVILESIIRLGSNLGLQVVAEGVEDAAIMHMLVTLDCPAAQGYHIARPQRAEAIEPWLRARVVQGREASAEGDDG